MLRPYTKNLPLSALTPDLSPWERRWIRACAGMTNPGHFQGNGAGLGAGAEAEEVGVAEGEGESDALAG